MSGGGAKQSRFSSRFCPHCTSLSQVPRLSFRQTSRLHAKCPLPYLTNGSQEKSERRKNVTWTISRLYLNAFPPLRGYFMTEKKRCFVCKRERVSLGKDWNRVHEIKASLSMKYISPFDSSRASDTPRKWYDLLCAKYIYTQRGDDTILESQILFCLNTAHQWDICRKVNVELWSQTTLVTAAGTAAATYTPFSACCGRADVLQNWITCSVGPFLQRWSISSLQSRFLISPLHIFCLLWKYFFAQAGVLGSGWGL